MTATLLAYKSHKIIHAAKITNITFLDDGTPKDEKLTGMSHLEFEYGQAIFKSKDYTERTKLREKVEAGDLGYYVVYDNGEYASWSPTKAFKEGYAITKHEKHVAKDDQE